MHAPRPNDAFGIRTASLRFLHPLDMPMPEEHRRLLQLQRSETDPTRQWYGREMLRDGPDGVLATSSSDGEDDDDDDDERPARVRTTHTPV